MKINNNVKTISISWLKNSYNPLLSSGVIEHFYQPESLEELVNICTELYNKEESFDIIGHTSNIYYLPNYSVKNMISTRLLNHYKIEDEIIICECGVSVKKLAREMVIQGFEGFYGLVDLPGTVAAAVYGNASCYECSINELLHSFDILCSDGKIRTLNSDALKLAKRSSSLKRKEIKGIIISVRLNLKKSVENEVLKAQKVQEKRKKTQPGPALNLGSIYKNPGKPLLLYYLLKIMVKVRTLFFTNNRNLEKELFFRMLDAEDLLPYVYGWNRFIWKDEYAHHIFWKFHKLHERLFPNSEFEIEIKGNY